MKEDVTKVTWLSWGSGPTCCLRQRGVNSSSESSHTHTHTWIHTYTHPHGHAHTHMDTHTHTDTHMDTYIYTHTHTWRQTHTQMMGERMLNSFTDQFYRRYKFWRHRILNLTLPWLTPLICLPARHNEITGNRLCFQMVSPILWKTHTIPPLPPSPTPLRTCLEVQDAKGNSYTCLKTKRKSDSRNFMP